MQIARDLRANPAMTVQIARTLKHGPKWDLKFHGHGPHAADQNGLKGRNKGENLAENSENFGKIDFARFGPNMALLAIGTVTAGLAQFF